MSTTPGSLDVTFTARIGVDIRGELWPCVAVPDSKELLGTGKTVKVAASVDGEAVTISLLPTGTGGHMLSLNAKLRKKLGKGLGDEVTVHLSARLS